jgi:hypothetical protein
LHLEHWEKSLSTAVEPGGTNVGGCIAGSGTWPQRAIDALDYFDNATANCGTWLDPNGAVRQGTSGTNLTKFYWKNERTGQDSAVTLLGFGFMGALSAGERVAHDPYFSSFRLKRSNLTRVWAAEQWAGRLASRQTTPYSCLGITTQQEGLTPFVGSLEENNFDLTTVSLLFLSNLRRFAQSAADRGIVVQLSLFDKHGLLDYPDYGGGGGSCNNGNFFWSPYFNSRNIESQDYIDDDWQSDCTCTAGFGDLHFTANPACVPPVDFLDDPVATHNNQFMQRVAEEVGGIGNVMFEVVNEARQGLDWPGEAGPWQASVAEMMKHWLPTRTARDAFNIVASNPITTRVPDARLAGGQAWASNGNVQVVVNSDPGGATGLQMGFATSRAQAGSDEMWASLPFENSDPWTEVAVRANLTIQGTSAYVGIQAANGEGFFLQYGDSGEPGSLAPDSFCPCVAFWHRDSAGTYVLLSNTEGWLGKDKSFQFRIRKGAVSSQNFASVYADGEDLFHGSEIDVGALPTFTAVVFGGSGPTPLPVESILIDNFEASYFCNTVDTPVACSPSQ